MDRLSDIAIFIRVLDIGSISAAARSLGLSSAVARKRLISLEKHIEVSLLHRTTRRISDA
ncbi:LysR family transcriptional regulator [Paraglaciecola sp.]|uniref:helix-turn-helix domain-containing protein n=1 Tax=Paraglaciecola sp. TaxID=1920173 RepID=UPI0030F3BF2A